MSDSVFTARKELEESYQNDSDDDDDDDDSKYLNMNEEDGWYLCFRIPCILLLTLICR